MKKESNGDTGKGKTDNMRNYRTIKKGQEWEHGEGGRKERRGRRGGGHKLRRK